MNKTISDRLFRDFLESDEKALTEIINIFRRNLEAFAASMTKNREQAEEIAQDSIIKLWENHKNMKSPAAIKSFLFRTAYNASIDYHRKRNYEATYIEHEKHTGEFLSEIEVNYDADVIFLRMELALAKMPEQRRKVFELSRKQDYTVQQIADMLDISHKTVRRHIELALADLRRYLVIITLLLFNL